MRAVDCIEHLCASVCWLRCSACFSLAFGSDGSWACVQEPAAAAAIEEVAADDSVDEARGSKAADESVDESPES